MSYVAPYEYRVTVPVRTSTHDQHPLPAPHLQPPTSAEVRSGQCLLLTYLLCLLACLLACGSLAGCATMTRYLITVFLPVSIRFRERSPKKRSSRAQRGLDRRPPFHSQAPASAEELWSLVGPPESALWCLKGCLQQPSSSRPPTRPPGRLASCCRQCQPHGLCQSISISQSISSISTRCCQTAQNRPIVAPPPPPRGRRRHPGPKPPLRRASLMTSRQARTPLLVSKRPASASLCSRTTTTAVPRARAS